MKAVGCVVVGGGAVCGCWSKGVVVAVAEGVVSAATNAAGGTKVAGDRTGVMGETGGRGGEFERRRSQSGRPCCVEIVRAGMFSLWLIMTVGHAGALTFSSTKRNRETLNVSETPEGVERPKNDTG